MDMAMFDPTVDYCNFDWRAASGAPQQVVNRLDEPFSSEDEPFSSEDLQATRAPSEQRNNQACLGTTAAYIGEEVGAGAGPEVSAPAAAEIFKSHSTAPIACEGPPSAQPRAQDPAQNMLSQLQARLQDIQESIKHIPRTGYAARSPPAKAEVPEVYNALLALALANQPNKLQDYLANIPSLGKRRADDDLDLNSPEFVGLTESERKKLLRMKRNRVSAQKSRERKKNHLESLSEHVEKVTEQNVQLAGLCKQLATENQELKAQLAELTATHALTSRAGGSNEAVR